MKRLFVLAVSFLIAAPLLAAQAPAFELFDPGTEEIVDYGKYGVFEGAGGDNYKYRITDAAGLKQAVGEGIFPNTGSILQDPAFKRMKKNRELEGDKWDYVNNESYQKNFFKWATESEEPGVKMYYTALTLEKSGNLKHAIKAYYAIVVNFPKSTGVTYWKTPWYVGPIAVDKINYLTRNNPQLGLKLVGADVKVINKFDDIKNNDSYEITPGRLIKVKPSEVVERKVDAAKLKVERTIGKGRVRLVRYSNKHWQLFVDGKPYPVKAIAYSPNKVGLSPDNGSLNVSRDWMFADFNKNGVIDGPYESWVDKNRNDKQDPGEKTVGDFQLLKEMGCNTLRIYHYTNLSRQLMKEGYEKYGFMYMMGNFIGMYCTDSGAEWFTGTDYSNAKQQQRMLDSVRKMVEEYKNEPYILMWVLGNENNFGTPGKVGISPGTGCRAKLQPEAYYKFVNEAAKLIKSLDPEQRPVAVCNGDVLFLDICAKNAPELDIFGANAYRGDQGFGALWRDMSEVFDRPCVVTEYGCPAFAKGWPQDKAEKGQDRYHVGNWTDIELNMAGSGAGTALGGVVFEWLDEWWKAGPPPEFDPSAHDQAWQFGAPFLDGYSYEEWLGLASQGSGKNSPFERQLRPAYFSYKKMWNK
jgi:hypothetical protein